MGSHEPWITSRYKFEGTVQRLIQESVMLLKHNTYAQLRRSFRLESLPAVFMYIQSPTPSFRLYNMLLIYAVLHMSSCKWEMTDLAKGMTHWQLTVIGFPPVD